MKQFIDGPCGDDNLHGKIYQGYVYQKADCRTVNASNLFLGNSYHKPIFYAVFRRQAQDSKMGNLL